MSRVLCTAALASGTLLIAAASANAGLTVSQTTAAAPTYGTILNFDAPGEPTGQLPPNTWVPTYGVSIQGGADNPFVGDFTGTLGPWAGNGNAIAAAWGLIYNWNTDLTELSFQAWDDSGPPTLFGGGVGVFVFKDGVALSEALYTPAWGGVGKSWFNITTTDGSTFDEVRVMGFGNFGPTTVMDNLSWNAVPTPGALALLGLGLAARSRRRA